MIRVFLILLAVIAIVLAIVLGNALLYMVAAALLIVAGVILTAEIRRRHARERGVVAPVIEQSQDDLKSLGIMEIRAKVPDSKAATSQKGEDAEAGAVANHEETTTIAEPEVPVTDRELDPAPAARTPAKSVSDPAVGRVRKRQRAARIMVEGVSDGLMGDVVLPTLRALRAAVDATTVVLLREERSPMGYEILGIVSRNAYARNGGRFISSQPLLKGQDVLQPLVQPCNATDGFNPKRLAYYHDAIAIHQVAMVTLDSSQGPVLMVVDRMEDGGLETEDARRLLTEFGRLIGALLREPAPRQDAPSGEPLRPRREIIAEEMAGARENGEPLALAFVHLNRADSIPESDRETAETEFQAELQAKAAEGRVERFGELTYGLFPRIAVDDLSTWASLLQVHFARIEGTLSGGISIGIAVLGDRHDGPDELRADATVALAESFETGECIILE